MKFKITLVIFAILTMFSCEFVPKGEFYPDVEEPTSAPQIEVELNVATDTIIVEHNNKLTFNFQTENLKVHWVKLYINNQHCGTYEQNSGVFSINGLGCNNSIGTYEMTLEAYTESGSGSIADEIGAEGFVFSKTWTLIITDIWSYRLKVISIQPDNKSLKINWEKFKGFDFKEYVILKSSAYSGFYDTLAIIRDQHITSIYDNSYVGERVYYRVDVKTNNEREYRGDGLAYKDTVPQVYIGDVNNHLMTLTWDKSKFINNIKGYEIYVRNRETSQFDLIAEINDGQDTSCVIDSLRFAYENEIVFITIPNKMPSYINGFWNKWQDLGSETKGSIGNKYLGGTIITPMGDYLYYQYSGTIYEYNYITNEITDSIQNSGVYSSYFSVSPNRKYILVLINSVSALVYNIETKEKKNYTVEELSGSSYGLYHPAISDNGIGVIQVAQSNTLVYDFINDREIFRKDLEYSSSKFNISANGRYFYKHNGHLFYEIQSDTIVQIWKNNTEITNSSFFEFVPDNADLIVLRDGDYLYKKRIIDLSTFSTYYIPNAQIINIDYNANKVLGAFDNRFRLYDLNSGEQLWTYPAMTYTYSYYGIRFCYNTIYDGHKGLKLKID